MGLAARVLHVDDEEGLLELTATFLERENEDFEVVSETSVRDALERLEDDDVDCVVSDYQMPDVDGLEFLERVRESHPSLPFVLFTGQGSEEVASDAITAGATDYLRKQAGTEQYRLLANRIENAVASYRAERELARYEALVETVGDPMYVLGEGGVVTVANRAMAEMLDACRADVVGAHASEFLAEGDFERGTELIVDLLGDPDRNSATYEVTVETTSGGEFFAEINVAPLLTDAGEYRATVGVVRDVTERKRREQRLLDREHELQRYEAILEGMGDGVYALDEDSNFVDVNDALVEMSGYDREAILEADPSIWHAEADIERFTKSIRGMLRTDEDVATVEATLETADGSQLTIEVTLTQLRDAGGEFAGTVGVVRDVTERKERERELEQYETIVQTFPDEVYTLDADGHFTSVVSPTGQERTQSGHRPEELMGDHVSTVMDEDDIATGEVLIRELLDSPDREKVSFEMDVITTAGERRPHENHIALLGGSDGEAFGGTVGVLRDISDRKRRERELERQNERLEEFARIASHDLRNPLTVAAGKLEFAREESDSEHLADVATQIDRMETIIEETLSMARHGEPVTTPECVDLRTLAQECWAAVATDEAGLEVTTDATIMADGSRFRRVLENLFRNAVEHGSTSPGSQAREDAVEHGSTNPRSTTSREDALEHGGDAVRVRVGETGDGVYVEDDGPGVPAEVRESLFDPGYTTDPEGTGFGLAIVEEIVEAHGWKIDVVDGESGGARFEISGVTVADD